MAVHEPIRNNRLATPRFPCQRVTRSPREIIGITVSATPIVSPTGNSFFCSSNGCCCCCCFFFFLCSITCVYRPRILQSQIPNLSIQTPKLSYCPFIAISKQTEQSSANRVFDFHLESRSANRATR